MIQHEVTVHINCPIEEVFAFLTQAENQTSWQGNALEITQLTEGAWTKGTRLREVRNIGGRRTESQTEIVEFEANHQFVVKSLDEPKVIGHFTTEPDGTGTKVTFHMQMSMGGVMRLMEPLVARSLKKAIDADFQRLKEVLEG